MTKMHPKNLMEDRRISVRADRILSIRHRLHKRSGEKFNLPWYISLTQNMSVTGVLFSSSAEYKKDDIVELDVVLSGVLDIFKGYGKVVRVQKKESGVVYSVAVQLIDLKNKGRRFTSVLRQDMVANSLPRRRKSL